GLDCGVSFRLGNLLLGLLKLRSVLFEVVLLLADRTRLPPRRPSPACPALPGGRSAACHPLPEEPLASPSERGATLPSCGRSDRCLRASRAWLGRLSRPLATSRIPRTRCPRARGPTADR